MVVDQIAAVDPIVVVDQIVVVDPNVAADLNAKVRYAVRNAANEVRIAPAVQLDPDAMASPPADRRRVQISASLILVMDCLPAEMMVDVTTLFAHVDLENASPLHHRPAAPVERPLQEDCREFLANERKAIHHSLGGEPLVVGRHPNSSVRPESSLFLTASLIHLPDLSFQESSVRQRHVPLVVDA